MIADQNPSFTSDEIKKLIENEFGISISITVINDFRRESNQSRVILQKSQLLLESGASEIAMALAMETGIIDAITDSICFAVEKKRESQKFKESASNPKDHPGVMKKSSCSTQSLIPFLFRFFVKCKCFFPH